MIEHAEWYKEYLTKHGYKGVDAYYQSFKAFKEGDTKMLAEMMNYGAQQ